MSIFLQDNPLAIHHASNPDGRDFVVGDLHGCRAMMDTLLDHVCFDPSKDRLFSVGDLVGSGTGFGRVSGIASRTLVFPVLGNHDAMLLAYWSTGSGERQSLYRDAFLYNPCTEWASSAHDLADRVVPLLEHLPFVRVVGDGEHRFQVLHAERRDNDTATFLSDADLDDPQSKSWDRNHHIHGFDDFGDWRDHLLWGRSYIQANQPCRFNPIKTLDFTGHTPVVYEKHPETVIQIGRQVYLDTGAFAAIPGSVAGLTLWDVQGDRGWRLLGDGQILDCRRLTGG